MHWTDTLRKVASPEWREKVAEINALSDEEFLARCVKAAREGCDEARADARVFARLAGLELPADLR